MSLEFSRLSEGTWEKLSQVAVKGAEYESRERQPCPKCLYGARVDLLNYIHRLLDYREKSRFMWLHGTAGVSKSAVVFTVAERMRGLEVTAHTNVDKWLGGTFSSRTSTPNWISLCDACLSSCQHPGGNRHSYTRGSCSFRPQQVSAIR